MTASEQIDQHIKETTDWRGEQIAKFRKMIHEVDPEIVEEWKWTTPVFVHKKMICVLGVFKDHVKINFFQGAALPDPKKLFNSGLEAKKTRAIDIFKNDTYEEDALKDLFRAAITLDEK